MKKRLICVTCIVLALLFALTGCGSMSTMKTDSAPAAADNSYYEQYNGGAGFEPEEAMDSTASADGNQAFRNAKLIYRANMNIQTLDFDNATASLEKLTADMGGYMESSQTYTGDYYSGRSSRSAYYTVRVPAEKFEAFLATVDESGIFHVTNVSRSADDIGTKYFDTEARLKTQQVKQERLLSLLEKADNMEDIISLENALSEVEYMIESYTSTLNRYDDLVGFATIEISLDEVARVTDTGETTSFGSRISAAFNNGVNSFVSAMEDFAVWLAAAILPLILVAIVIALAVIIPVRVSRKRRRRFSAPGKDDTDK